MLVCNIYHDLHESIFVPLRRSQELCNVFIAYL